MVEVIRQLALVHEVAEMVHLSRSTIFRRVKVKTFRSGCGSAPAGWCGSCPTCSAGWPRATGLHSEAPGRENQPGAAGRHDREAEHPSPLQNHESAAGCNPACRPDTAGIAPARCGRARIGTAWHRMGPYDRASPRHNTGCRGRVAVDDLSRDCGGEGDQRGLSGASGVAATWPRQPGNDGSTRVAVL